MRELKFRAWDNSELLEDVAPYSDNEIVVPYFWTKVDCIEQYIGLKDKNGKEIYEGDIITETYPASENGKYKESGEYKAKDYWVVKYDKKRAGFSPFCDCDDNGEYLFEEHIPKNHVEVEVVGNIHENKELLDK